MEKINSEIFISSLFAFGFLEIDPVLFTMLLRKFSIDNQAKQQFIYEDKSFNPEFFQYVDFSTGKFRLKNNLTIIQKYDPSYLDIANGDYYKDDFIALTIPINSLPSHLQNNINKTHKQQTSSNRKNPNKVLEMRFDDLLELSKVIINEKDKTKRIKIDTLKGYFKNNKFDEQLLYGYAEKTFTTPWVVDKIEKSERMKLEDRNRVVQKNYYNVDNGQDVIPKSSHAMSGARKDILMDENKPFIDKKQTSMKNEQFNHRDLYFDEI